MVSGVGVVWNLLCAGTWSLAGDAEGVALVVAVGSEEGVVAD